MPFKKGQSGNKDGRRKGALNRTTKEAKIVLERVLLGQVDNIEKALTKLNTKDPARYLDACSKLFTYVLPKKTDITIDPPIIKLPDIVIKTKNG